METGSETFLARARELSGKEREEAFAKSVAVYPPYADYQKRTERQIPVFLLERQKNL